MDNERKTPADRSNERQKPFAASARDDSSPLLPHYPTTLSSNQSKRTLVVRDLWESSKSGWHTQICGKAQKVGGTHRYVGKLKKWVAHTDGTHRCTDDLPPLKKRFEDSNVMLR